MSHVTDAPAPCARCGYDLRGVADDAPCPECGLLAGRSRVRSDDLYDASPRWLRGIAAGIGLVLVAHLILLCWWWVFERVYQYYVDDLNARIVAAGTRLPYTPTFLGMPIDFDYLALLGFDVASVTFAWGLLLVTRPQRRPDVDRGDRAWRVALRLFGLVPLATVLFMHAWLLAYGSMIRIDPFHMSTWTPTPGWGVLLAMTVGCAPLPVLFFGHLRRLARRVRHPNLVEHATIVAIGSSVTLLALPAVLWTLAALDRRGRGFALWQSGARSVLLLAVFGAFLLMAVWSTLNCVRFLVAFWRAYRGARRAWVLADRAAVPPAVRPATRDA